jgi:hypothetical protein
VVITLSVITSFRYIIHVRLTVLFFSFEYRSWQIMPIGIDKYVSLFHFYLIICCKMGVPSCVIGGL